MREETYTQCKLKKDNTYQMSWSFWKKFLIEKWNLTFQKDSDI